MRLSRPGRTRLDVSAETELSSAGPVSLTRIAHQIRQDIWRALRRQRGFSPIVRVALQPDSLKVTAGGMLTIPNAAKAHLEKTIEEVLQKPANRLRWCRFARLKETRHG